MMPLASWLLCAWRHAKPEGHATVVRAAQALDQAIWDRHGFKLMFLDDPARFRDLSEKEVERATRGVTDPEDAPDYPQLGTHTDPTCRAMSRDDFFALIGCVTERPLHCITMNTAALYEDGGDLGLFSLFRSQRLWSDHPERDCPGLMARVRSDDAAMLTPLPAVYTGTAWVTPMRRKRGIARTVSRLHRMVAWLRWPVPQFATVVPDRNHDKLFNGRDIGSVTETRPQSVIVSRVLFYAPEEICADAERVLSAAPSG